LFVFVGLGLNAEKSKYMLVSPHQNSGQDRDTTIANRSFENVSQLKYLETIVTDTNLSQGEIRRTLNSGSACYHSIQNLLSYRLLSKTAKTILYRAII
jgi:hypothetical protein